ncbi:chromosome segregation protein SMC [Undibacterium sp. RTI2.1]|uniref:chromosome segregation protein SMC n=1 Tax=unclassified Undibacterium TaxID=2630295 RepID=UPI002AB36539|nr:MULTISPECIES: chromosome segregation protein SMC [unclassified Undibacterium]MDY7538265.1 chromosome segregation protein SMC [Undibacterium sp. 5I1]MEB0030912.1 chromosome segregation protein SMC [Undibacterium sp. RTI2.1]MEB0117410.1 chromosome segregation protein SMC [Undibacterium sp. RTI2.2]MEB0229462.1 chromosome segregation protein SMC [Undibacterium sp. 10I3]MEB0256072.1 chromosome segregation protein SMC [Undibacterium sp. 5I1]
MRLTSIKLSGFKSFVDPTNFQVPGQLVGVVGPNGCGKSNIIDAVRWVLGESKASELRGESMQDVIFNGSTHRKPAGRSSVELVFDNSLGKAAGQWSQYAEIAVKRTLTRDGTSTYYINGQPVRRRDIQDIFMGTGLGPRAYAIIGQGMISRIIEARPEELRIFLEEAAGVSRYKERRRETENRIHDTHENLVRVEDILRELNANLEKLEAQAVVANKYNELQGDQEEKQKLLWLLRKNEAANEQTRYFAEIEKTQIDLEEQTAKLRHVELELEQMRQAHYAVGDKMHQAQGHLYHTNAEIGSLEAQIKFVIESRSRLQSQLNSLTAQRDQWQRQGQQFQDDLAEAEIHVEELGERSEQAQEIAQQQNDKIPALEQVWREAQLKTTESRAKIMQLQQQIELESAHQRNASNILNTLATRKERLQQEKQGLAIPDNVHLENLSLQLEEKKQVLEESSMQLEEAQERLPIIEEERRAAQQQVNQDAAASAQLDARLQALKQLQEKVLSQGKVQPWLEKHELSGLPKLWQKLHIQQGWETALEAVLRERTSALEMSNLDWAKAFFNDAPPAKLALYSPQVNTPTTESVAGLQPLLSLLQLNDAGVRGLLQDWLHQVYASDDVASAFQNRDKLPLGACFITKQGHVISKTSVRFYAADSEQDGVLARQQEIDNISKQSRAQQMLADESKTRTVRAESAYTQAAQSLQELRQRVTSLTQTVHSLQIEFMKLSEVQARFNQRSTQIMSDLTEIAAQESEQQQAKIESEEKFEMLDIDLAELQENHEQAQTNYLEKEQHLTDARHRLRDLELAAQESAFSEKTHRNKMEELRRSIATAVEQSAQLFANMQQGHLELEEMDDQTAQAGLQSLLEKRSDQERALSDARHELDQLTQKLRQVEESKMQVERSLQPQRDRIVELQLKEQAARLNQEQFAEQLRNFDVDEQALSQKLHDDMKPSYLQGEVTRLTNAIAALGAVNMAALDELAQATERKTFLDAQYADLNEAITTLQDAIHKIDIETRDLLQDTFNKVNLHFAELFPILFGGGQAKLIMTGDEILDSGVQVMAQPPGKKNATIHLLSGGEKALTATALVFSMFQLNPAPFCLLDEVDAPLDDSNTERFCNMVKRMSANTQFLFISHNKIAMEMAQQLIGVTMQEQGVSRIVAVDMESAAHFASEAQAA